MVMVVVGTEVVVGAACGGCGGGGDGSGHCRAFVFALVLLLLEAVAMLVTVVFAVSVVANAVVAMMAVEPLGGEAVVAVGGGAAVVKAVA
jgi:hypothetical protein